MLTKALLLSLLLIQAGHAELLICLDAHDSALAALRLAPEAVLSVFQVQLLIADDTRVVLGAFT